MANITNIDKIEIFLDQRGTPYYINGRGAFQEFKANALTPASGWIIIEGAGLGSSERCGQGNSASGNYSTISGGKTHTASALYGTIGGGWQNTISTKLGTISGGYQNLVCSASVDGGGTIGGGYLNQVQAEYGTISGGASNIITFEGGAVGGGQSNIAAYYAGAFSGFGNTATNDYAFIGGGFNNTSSAYASSLSGGVSNTSSGNYAFVGSGFQLSASGSGSGVMSGADNTASSQYSTISGGNQNTASAVYSTITGGAFAVASRLGQRTFSSGKFGTNGDSQFSELVARQTTTEAIPEDLILGGSNEKITIAVGYIFAATMNIFGISSDGTQYAHFCRKVAIQNLAGTTSLLGAVSTIGTDVNNTLSMDVTITADDVNDSLKISVTGVNSTVIKWTAYISAVEIKRGL